MTRRVVSAIAVVVLIAACNQSPESQNPPKAQPAPAKPRPTLVASFYPLYEFARQVAGDSAEVTSLVPTGVEPHDWEPAPQDVARLEKARVFVYNGAGFEPWADKLLANLGGKGPTVVVATQGISLLGADLPGHGHEHDRTTDQHPGDANHHLPSLRRPHPRVQSSRDAAIRQDPHVWLDPVLAQRQVESIRAALAHADPDNAARYAANAKAFSDRLAAVAEHYERGLAQCARREIVVSHALFAYPAKRYGLTQVPVMGLSPDSEPSPAQMAQIVRFARRHKVTFIFFETLVSPKLADTLAREVGAKTLVLDPIEGLTKDEQAAGKSYVDLMEENLRNLRTALACT